MKKLKAGGSPVFYIGTSGWTYDHWLGNFYPAQLAKSHWFEFYAAQFNAVEINATFYRFFRDQTYVKWKTQAPQGFGYVLKAPKIITHRKMLKEVETEIRTFCHSADLLGDTFQMFLLQVAPNQPYDPELLRSALQAFSDPSRVAVEFRHEQWFNAEIERLLTSLGAVFCNVDSPRQCLTEILTAPRAYVRLHGHGRWYGSNYSADELLKIAELVHRLTARGAKWVYIFFNNDYRGYAPANARLLQKMLSK